MPDTKQQTRNDAFDRETYVKMLIAIARADKENGLPEYRYIRRQASELEVDFENALKTTDKRFEIGASKTSRVTALQFLKDAISIASMDGNFSLPEKQKVYTYAEKLDIARSDVDELERMVAQTRDLNRRWLQLVAGRPNG